jgi:hypothetical protein
MSPEPSQTKDWTHLFAQFRGQWVAFADDELTVLAAGVTAKEALAASVAKGSPDPILYRMPDRLDTFVGTTHPGAADDAEFERLKREESELRARIRGFSGGDRLSRDAVHERGA